MALTDPHEKSFDRDAALGQSVRNGVPVISAPPLSKMGLILFLFLISRLHWTIINLDTAAIILLNKVHSFCKWVFRGLVHENIPISSIQVLPIKMKSDEIFLIHN